MRTIVPGYYQFKCDFCGAIENIENEDRPPGWSTLKHTTEASPILYHLCRKCTPVVSQWIAARVVSAP